MAQCTYLGKYAEYDQLLNTSHPYLILVLYNGKFGESQGYRGAVIAPNSTIPFELGSFARAQLSTIWRIPNGFNQYATTS
ncbi:hypothetical protein [Pseudoalteromonas sp.]|uniref:hypothetical protein n=1 Tax=Pseudoalteromonas sp. TaxID=53249 RepID=UPI0030017978